MKKIILFICLVLFLLGIALNFQYAVNDYDIKTNSLHPLILAQDSTGTGSGTGSGSTPSNGKCAIEIKCKLKETETTVGWPPKIVITTSQGKEKKCFQHGTNNPNGGTVDCPPNSSCYSTDETVCS